MNTAQSEFEGLHMKNFDIFDLGDFIENAVDKAISSQNFSELNKSISQAIDRSADLLRGTGNETEADPFGSPLDRRHRRYVTPGGNQTSQPTKHTFPADARTYRSARKKRAAFPVAVFPAGQIAGILQTALGGTFSFSFFFAAIGCLIGLLAPGSSEFSNILVALIILFVVLTGASVGILGRGIYNLKLVSRFRRYCRAIGNRSYCALTDLANGCGRSVSQVKKDLHIMLSRNMFLEGHLDKQGTCLMVTDESYRQYCDTQKAWEEQQQQRMQAAKEQAASGLTEEQQKIIDEGNAYIKRIRQCNDDLPGEIISAKLYRLELVITKIFDRVKKQPQLAPELHRFMNYYLPTTWKLIDAYRDMETQKIDGPNIAATKQEIEQTLDTINTAFENLLDSFYQDTAWDISSDISVMQTMMAQDGLTKKDFDKKK